LLTPGKAVGQVFELGHALGVVFQGVAAGAGAAGGEGVTHADDEGFGGGGFDVVVVGIDGVHDGLVHAVLLGEVGADVVVATLDLVRDGLADVVEQGGGLGDADVGADVFGDHAGQVGHFDGVLEDVLRVGGAEFELAEELDELDRDADDAGFFEGLLAGFFDHAVDFGLGLGDDFLDAGGVDAAVGQELFEGDAGDLAAHGVEGRQHDGAGGFVDDDVDAGGALQRLDVAAFFADDAALELVGLGSGTVVMVRSAVWSEAMRSMALNDDHLGAVFGLFLGLVLELFDELDQVGS
jgi:hypothetical protein